MALCKTIEKKNIDTNQIRAEASALAANLAGQAGRAAEWVGPRVTKAAGGVARAAKEAQERLEPAYEEARPRVVEDYIPRAQRAAAAAQAAAQSPGTVGERAQRAAVAAREAVLAPPPAPRKSHRVLKTFGWIALAGGAAAAAYIIWRRSQPVEDPWAEEYWADSAEEEDDDTEAVAEA